MEPVTLAILKRYHKLRDQQMMSPEPMGEEDRQFLFKWSRIDMLKEAIKLLEEVRIATGGKPCQ